MYKPYEGLDSMLLERNGKLTMHVEVKIIAFVI